MKNYEEKYNYLYFHQAGLCSGCGKKIPHTFFEKSDLAHNLSRTEHNRKNFPKFIDSMLNMTIQHNKCNVSRLLPKHAKGKQQSRQINYFQAEQYEKFLQRHPKLEKFVNGVW